MNEEDKKIIIAINWFFSTASSTEYVFKPLVSDVFTRVSIQKLKLKHITFTFVFNLFILIASIKIKNEQIVFNFLSFWNILLSNYKQVHCFCYEWVDYLTSFLILCDLNSMEFFFIVAVDDHHISILYRRKCKVWPIETKRLNGVAHKPWNFEVWLVKFINNWGLTILINMLFFFSLLIVFNLMIIQFIIIQTNNCHNVFPIIIISQ